MGIQPIDGYDLGSGTLVGLRALSSSPRTSGALFWPAFAAFFGFFGHSDQRWSWYGIVHRPSGSRRWFFPSPDFVWSPLAVDLDSMRGGFATPEMLSRVHLILRRSTVSSMFNSAASKTVSLKEIGGYNRPHETHVKARKSRYHTVTHKLLPLVGIKPQFFFGNKNMLLLFNMGFLL